MSYSHIVPTGSFLHNYMESMSNSETALDYDFWCGLWLLSLACSRDVIVARPNAPVFMNLYVILVAESGITRKSTAIRHATNIAAQLVEDDPLQGLITGKTIPEKLDDILHRRTADVGTARAAIAISELAVFLGLERYNVNMPALLTDLYDCPTVRSGGGTISRGALDQRECWLSFLSASTPTWLLRSVNPSVVAGGFTSRCLFVVSEEPKKRIAWGGGAEPTQPGISTPSSSDNLVTQLKEIRTHARQYKTITANDAAIRHFTTWYSRRRFSRDPFNSSFESREDAHILRLAGLLAVNDGTWIIQKAHVAFAIRAISAIKSNGYRIFAATQPRHRWVLGYERLRDALVVAGHDPLPRSQLFLKVRGVLDNEEYSALLDVLHELGGIQRYTLKREGAGRPADLIRGTKLLHARGFTERVVDRLGAIG